LGFRCVTRNVLLQAAGYAPVFPERPLGDPALKVAWQAIEQVLAGHEPNPALAVDRHWTLFASNSATRRLLAEVEPSLLRPSCQRATPQPASARACAAHSQPW
jgi:hypothetical protein